jgi:predicted MFS family arabinose efflux permease
MRNHSGIKVPRRGSASVSGIALTPAACVAHGYRTAFLITATIGLASAIIAALLPASSKPESPPKPASAVNAK